MGASPTWRALPLATLLLACSTPSRDSIQLAADLRRSPPGADLSIADRPFDCDARDRACLTLWLYRGAACATLAESPATPEPARAARRDCAVASFTRARDLTPADATPDERAETAIRLADALERRRDRATAEARQADNAAILTAIAPLRTLPGGAGYADHYAAGVTLNRVQAGDIPPAFRCAELATAREAAARASGAPGLPPLTDRTPARRAALAAQSGGCP